MYSGSKFIEKPTIEDELDAEDALIDDQPDRDGSDDELTSLLLKHENLRRQVALLNAQLAEKQEAPKSQQVTHERPTNGRAFTAVVVAMVAAGILVVKSL